MGTQLIADKLVAFSGLFREHVLVAGPRETGRSWSISKISHVDLIFETDLDLYAVHIFLPQVEKLASFVAKTILLKHEGRFIRP